MALLLVIQCNKASETENIRLTQNSRENADSVKLNKQQQEISYYPLIINRKKDSLKHFSEKYDKEQIHLILAMNRLDYKNRWRADTLVVPKVFDKDFRAYSPFPIQISSGKKINKLALFSYEIHAYALYESGKLVKWGPTSMGKKSTPTNKGLSFTNWKKKIAISSVNSSWKLRWNFNIYNYQGIGWHQYDLPGFHASHSCVRLLEEDAFFMYSWADEWILDKSKTQILGKGTPVIIFGTADFEQKPWMNLLKSPEANNFSEIEIYNEIEPFLPEILMQQQIREDFLAKSISIQ